MSTHETSTGQSYLDKATGAIQSGIGSLTGNTADKVSFPLLVRNLKNTI